MSRCIRTVWVLFIVCLSLLLFGCGENGLGNLGESAGEPAQGDVVVSAEPLPYLVKNPVEIVTRDVTEGSHTENTFIIEGLSDKGVQDSINARLEAVYEGVVSGELPPYRGISRKIPAESILTGSNANANMSFNHNNVASVVVYGNRSFSNSANVGVMEGLTFDLSTGDEITLKQVFADDVDYKALLNDKISQALEAGDASSEESEFMMMGPGLRLVAPFKGIGDDQKFYLFQGGLCLIFDYETPEFDTDLYGTTLNIGYEELGKAVAVTRRFCAEENYEKTSEIYESRGLPVYEFLPVWEDMPIREDEVMTVGNVNVYQSLMVNENIPAQALEKARALYPVDPEALAAFEVLISQTSGPGIDPGVWNSFEQNVWTGQVGEYTMVSRNTSLYFGSRWKNQVENFCFDGKGNEIGLADLFVSDYNYREIVLAGLKKALSERTDLIGIPEEPLLEDLMENLQFALNISDVSFTTTPLQGADSSESPVYFTITFEEFGCPNLVIFAPFS